MAISAKQCKKIELAPQESQKNEMVYDRKYYITVEPGSYDSIQMTVYLLGTTLKVETEVHYQITRFKLETILNNIIRQLEAMSQQDLQSVASDSTVSITQFIEHTLTRLKIEWKEKPKAQGATLYATRNIVILVTENNTITNVHLTEVGTYNLSMTCTVARNKNEQDDLLKLKLVIETFITVTN